MLCARKHIVLWHARSKGVGRNQNVLSQVYVVFHTSGSVTKYFAAMYPSVFVEIVWHVMLNLTFFTHSKPDVRPMPGFILGVYLLCISVLFTGLVEIIEVIRCVHILCTFSHRLHHFIGEVDLRGPFGYELQQSSYFYQNKKKKTNLTKQ